MTTSGAFMPGVDVHLVIVGRFSLASSRPNANRFAGRELTVHGGRRDADALLPSALLQCVEFGSVEQLGEDLGDLGFDDTRAIVLDGYAEPILGQGLDVHLEIGEDAGFLTCVEGVVDSFFDRR